MVKEKQKQKKKQKSGYKKIVKTIVNTITSFMENKEDDNKSGLKFIGSSQLKNI